MQKILSVMLVILMIVSATLPAFGVPSAVGAFDAAVETVEETISVEKTEAEAEEVYDEAEAELSATYDKATIRKKIIEVLYNGAGGKMTCDFDGYTTQSGRHEGIDFKYKTGASIYSVIDGIVTSSRKSNGLTTTAIYNSDLDITVIYLHHDLGVETGNKVKVGQKIGKEANNAGGDSAHTHIEIRKGKKTSASISVGDNTLDNPNPYPYWNKIFNLKPGTPEITSCKAISDTEVTIKWGKVYGADKYKIVRNEVDGANEKTITSSCTGTSYTDKNLQPGTTYYYKVYAIDTDTSKTSSASKKWKTYTMPKTPEQPWVAHDSSSQLTVTWDPVGTDHKYLYEVWCKLDDGNHKYDMVADNLTTTEFVHKGLKAGTKYCYYIVAKRVGNIGESGNYTEQAVKSEQSPKKTKLTHMIRPTCGVDNDNVTNVTLKWKALVGNQQYFYKVERDGVIITPSYLSETTYVDKTATPGKIHQYIVRGYELKDGEYSERTDTEIFYAGSKNTTPIQVEPYDKTTMKISWTVPEGAPSGLQYRVKKLDNATGEYLSDPIGVTTDTYFYDRNLTTGQTYNYYIQIRDANNNYVTSTFSVSAVLDIKPTSINLDKTAAVLTEGDSMTLNAAIAPSNSFDQSLTWTSSNTNVATVSGGVVTAKMPGTATIAVTSNANSEVKATCTVEVVAKTVAVTGVTLNKTTAELTVGDYIELIPTVAPSNATNKNVTWASSDTSVATVSGGFVTAHKAGAATISVVTSDGAKTAKCVVTVKEKVIAVESIVLGTNEESVTVGDTLMLFATINPENASNKNVTWKSSNEAVATVENGIVEAVAAGVAEITVITVDGSKTATCTVNVKEKTIEPVSITLDKSQAEGFVGEEIILIAEVLPVNATNKNVIWKSSSDEIASVEDGFVMLKEDGTATITATIEGTQISASAVITVKETETVPVEYDLEFNIGHVVGKAGDTVKLPLILDNDKVINSLAVMNIVYDNEALEFAGFEKNEEFIKDAVFKEFDTTHNTISIGWTESAAYSGKVCSLVFKIKETANEGTYDVAAESVVKNNLDLFTSGVNDGSVTVTLQRLGDIDLNEGIDINDAILLFQYSMMPEIYELSYVGSLDFNKDGALDINDAILLFQHSMMPEVYPLD